MKKRKNVKAAPARRKPAERPLPRPAPGPAGESLIRCILVPVDFSAHSKNALRYAVPLAARFGASLRLVYVVEPTIYPADLGFGQVVLPEVEEELVAKGKTELQALIDREIGGVVKASATVRTGKPHQEILREAEDQGVDIIVIATHGHTGVEHILFGSTASRIVRLADCPVMTIRPDVRVP